MATQQISRRAAIGMLAGGIAMATTPSMPNDGWITIAHRGMTRNRHIYSEWALDSMCAQLPGEYVSIPLVMGLCPLEAIVGIIEVSRRTADGDVQVRVSWFQGLTTIGKYLAP